MKTTAEQLKSELKVQKTAKANGFLFPTTDEELNQFDQIHGSTKIPVPVSLQNPNFLFEQFSYKKMRKEQEVNWEEENESMFSTPLAANGNQDNLPSFVRSMLAKSTKKKATIKKNVTKKVKKK